MALAKWPFDRGLSRLSDQVGLTRLSLLKDVVSTPTVWRWRRTLTGRNGHMEEKITKTGIYDAGFYARISKRSYKAARTVLPLLIEAGIPFGSVTDVGGGTGSWSRAALRLGATRVTLIDGAHVDPSSLAVPPACFIARNLTQRMTIPTRSDLAICVEVAEHLPPPRAAGFIEDLCAISDNVLFSAALPFQGGDGHVNEMWPEYWASLFAAQGFDAYDFIRPAIWMDTRVDWWYRQNLLFFARRPEEAPQPRVIGGHRARRADAPLTRIHPEAYVWLAYRPRPQAFRTPAQRAIRLQADSGSLGKPPRLGYGGEFDSVPRPELMDINGTTLRAVIVGPGRTGSTALTEALTDHRGVFCLNESQELPMLQARFGSEPAPTHALCEQYLAVRFTPEKANAETNAQRAGKSPTHLRAYLDRLASAEPELAVARFARYVAAYFRAISGSSVLVDKTPDHAHHLDALLGLWPDLRIVLMVREPGHTALSMRGHDGYRLLAATGEPSWARLMTKTPGAFPEVPSGATAPDALGPYLDIWSARVADALAVGNRLDSTQFTILRYEDLLADPRGELRRLLRFLGGDPDPSWIESAANRFAPPTGYDRNATREAEEAVSTHASAAELKARLGYAG